MIPLSLVHNLSLLATLCLLNGFLMRWFQRRGLRYSLLMGLLFGAATLIGMSTPVVQRPGLIFDGRSIVLGIAGFFGGPVVAGVAAVMAAAFRINLGGPGALMGVLVILESSMLGVAGYFLRRRWQGMTGPMPVLGLGLAIHLLVIALMVVLPGGMGMEVLKRLGLIILIGYPIGFMLVGLAFVELEKHFRTEAALQLSEARFRTVFEKGIDGMLMFGTNGAIIDANDAFARMRGYTRNEVLQLHLRDLDTPETAKFVPERMRRLLAGETLNVELEEVHKDGHVFQVEATASLVLLGEKPAILSFHRDITERKRAEEALRESEAKLQMLLDSTAEGIFGIDLEGRCTFCNPACLRMIGHERAADLLGRNMHDLIHHSHPEGNPLHVDDCRIFQALRDGQGTHAEDEVLWRADGTSFPAEYWSYPQRIGERIVGAVVAFTDITVRKQAEEALRMSEDRFRRISASMMDIAYACSRQPGGDFAIDWMIGATEPLLGRSIEEIKAARCWLRFVVDEDRPLFEKHVVGLAPGESSACELRLRKKDGSPAWFESFAQCESSAGNPTQHQLHGALVNISARKFAEEQQRVLEAQLQQAQKMESLGGLAGGIAHDMNNVLGAILGLASASAGAQPAGSQLRKALETIIKAAERGGKMVRGLLSFAHQTTAEERKLDMNELLQEQVRLLERTTLAKVRIKLDLASDLRPIMGDPSSLTHALMNLSINSVDAMPDSGTLSLRTRNVDSDWIEVCVEDTGTGMPKNVLDRALDPFFSTKEQGKGTGLGLSLVYSTVKAHQGQMAIHSEPGRGTSVSLRFPAATAEAPEQEAMADLHGEPTQGGLKILLIDDDELIQTSVRMLLEVLGHTVASAPNGEQALALVETGYQPDLAILDMNMPGLGGTGTLPRLRVLLPDLPVLLATGRADETALNLIQADANTTLLSKPFSMQEMKSKIESELKRSRARI